MYFRLSFFVTGIALMFIQWMADSPAAYSALKFINKLTGTAQERYIRKLQGLHGGSGVPWNELLSPFDNQWIDDICKLPAVEFDTSFILWRPKGAHTLEAMKAYRKVLRITIIIQASKAGANGPAGQVLT